MGRLLSLVVFGVLVALCAGDLRLGRGGRKPLVRKTVMIAETITTTVKLQRPLVASEIAR
jgi:hypothetical protein